jgi:hypothetical protein
MNERDDIPLLTDLIEPGPEFTMSDLGLEDDPALGAVEDEAAGDIAIDIDEAAPIAGAPAEIDPALEQTLRRILDEHTELAWQEIRLAIKQHLDRS